MYQLLTEMAIFLPLPNGCLCQVAGEVLILSAPPNAAKQSRGDLTGGETAVKRKAKVALDTLPHKRRKLNRTTTRYAPEDICSK
jgi:hypothetical protein